MTASTMVCDRCGAGVPAGASTCPSCGAPVGAAAYETRKVDAGWSAPEIPEEAKPEPPDYEPTVKIPETPAVEPVPPVYSPPVYSSQSLPEAPKPRSRVWQIVAGCAALLVICCCLVVVAGVIIYLQSGAF